MMLLRSSLCSSGLAVVLPVMLAGCLDPNITGTSSDTDTTGQVDTGTASDATSVPTTGTTGDMDEPPPATEWPTLDCDPLVPSYCGYPFPSNVFTRSDAGSPTGRRLQLAPATMPRGSKDASGPPDLWNRADGFSPGLAMMAHLPGATVTGLPSPWNIAESLAEDCPTVVLDAETGERVPHFAELDMSHDDPERRTFKIRPVVRLDDATRYIVAIRHVQGADGMPLAPSPVFQALRDVTDLPDEPSVATRRPLYADIFAKLAAAGVPRDDLQLAWDFTTASREYNTAGMLKMRDEALAMVGTAGPAYTLTSVVENPAEHIALKVEGMMTVPLYLDQPGPGARFVVGPDGLPQQNGTAEYKFTVVVPPSALTSPGAPLQYGHGLLGSGGNEIQLPFRVKFADTYNYVLFAVDWVGMASDDLPHILSLIDQGRISDFASVVERGQQGLVNALLAMRLVRGDLANDPALQLSGTPVIDPSVGHYHGNSQGGIFGGTYMALTTDVSRGMLGVPGQPYNLLLNRSKDFDPFFDLLVNAFPDGLDQQFVLALFQMLWDHSEPNGYTSYIRNNLLPGTPTHEVLLQVAIGDHQVSTLGAHIMARAVGGVVNLGPTNREVWGLDVASGPHTGSAMIEYEFGLAQEPTTNIPPSDGEDPHGKVRRLPSAEQSLDQFLRTGVIESFCDGPCDPE